MPSQLPRIIGPMRRPSNIRNHRRRAQATSPPRSEDIDAVSRVLFPVGDGELEDFRDQFNTWSREVDMEVSERYNFNFANESFLSGRYEWGHVETEYPQEYVLATAQITQYSIFTFFRGLGDLVLIAYANHVTQRLSNPGATHTAAVASRRRTDSTDEMEFMMSAVASPLLRAGRAHPRVAALREDARVVSNPNGAASPVQSGIRTARLPPSSPRAPPMKAHCGHRRSRSHQFVLPPSSPVASKMARTLTNATAMCQTPPHAPTAAATLKAQPPVCNVLGSSPSRMVLSPVVHGRQRSHSMNSRVMAPPPMSIGIGAQTLTPAPCSTPPTRLRTRDMSVGSKCSPVVNHHARLRGGHRRSLTLGSVSDAEINQLIQRTQLLGR
eukprot:GFYU01006834.1.p1 GENE.GFYU01006834.1~~GFYU01006834.1.p1  ORF type:complete len:383 (+),score=61.51 GFYU01006834.1:173-1321(+)